MTENTFTTSQERIKALIDGISIKDIERLYLKNNGIKLNNACLLRTPETK